MTKGPTTYADSSKSPTELPAAAELWPPAAAVAGTSCPAACSCSVPSDAAYRCTQLKCTTAASQLLLLSMVLAAAFAAEAAAAAAPSSRPRNQAPIQHNTTQRKHIGEGMRHMNTARKL